MAERSEGPNALVESGSQTWVSHLERFEKWIQTADEVVGELLADEQQGPVTTSEHQRQGSQQAFPNQKDVEQAAKTVHQLGEKEQQLFQVFMKLNSDSGNIPREAELVLLQTDSRRKFISPRTTLDTLKNLSQLSREVQKLVDKVRSYQKTYAVSISEEEESLLKRVCSSITRAKRAALLLEERNLSALIHMVKDDEYFKKEVGELLAVTDYGTLEQELREEFSAPGDDQELTNQLCMLGERFRRVFGLHLKVLQLGYNRNAPFGEEFIRDVEGEGRPVGGEEGQ